MRARAATYLLPAAWFLLILAATSVPSPRLPDVGIRFADKLLHAAIYFPLGLLLFRAMGGRGVRPALLALLACAAAGALDELHQLFIPGRSCDAVDLLADALGAGAGVLVQAALPRRARPGAGGGGRA